MKIENIREASRIISEWKTNNKKVVFTNGCFDIIHYGHIHYLNEAKSLGDKLIVGINSTESVRRLKGIHRPINDEKTRTHILASLIMVDLIVVFDEDTPINLISEFKPDILVKGGDWDISKIVGYDIVKENGGEVISLSFIDGYSTTNIESKIRMSLP